MEGGPHLLQSCFHAAWDNLFVACKRMHPFFGSLAITDALSLQASLMDTHHDTSFESILEDDFISSTSTTYICSCLGKGVRLWLIIRLFVSSFHIAHFIFTLMLHFGLDLIQPSTFNLFTYECGWG